MHDHHDQRPQPQSPNARQAQHEPFNPGAGFTPHQPFNAARGHAPQQQPSNPGGGRPMQAPMYTEPVGPAAPAGPSKALIGVMAAGLLVAAAGMVYKIVHKPEPKPPVVRAPSMWEQQQSMMREALDMAREAQQMQRERQAEMQRAMEESGEYSGGGDDGW